MKKSQSPLLLWKGRENQVKQQLENTEEIIWQCCLVGGLLFTVSYLNYTDF